MLFFFLYMETESLQKNTPKQNQNLRHKVISVKTAFQIKINFKKNQLWIIF